MCLVHQTEAQSNHCAVHKSEMCPVRSDLQCKTIPAQMHTTRILSDMFKYMAVGLFGCRDLLLSKKPCAVAESEVNVGKLDMSESRKFIRDFDHHDTVET